ncbi:hypothetical protein ACIOEX_27340, partial [Streptomyces sp. NPDC087850]
IDLLAALPATRYLRVTGLGDVLFCHATPRDDEELVLTDRDDEELVLTDRDGEELVLTDRADEEPDAWEAAYDGIRRAVSPVAPDGAVAEFLLRAEGGRAWFRWSDTPFDEDSEDPAGDGGSR